MYVKAPIPSEVYHLTKKANLESILDDGAIRRFDDTECWFCESLAKMKAYMEQTVLCEGKPYYGAGGQLCRYPKFEPDEHIILKLTPCRREGNWYRWNQEIPLNSPPELVQAAAEFSKLKIGFRGDLPFRNAEAIDVAEFLHGSIVCRNVQTTSELWKRLSEKVEQNWQTYQRNLYDRSPGVLIGIADEIAATATCYSEFLCSGSDLSRRDLSYLLQFENPLDVLQDRWVLDQSTEQGTRFLGMLESLRSEGHAEQDYPLDVGGFNSVTSSLMVLFCIILMAYAVIKVFFANLKRGGILLIQIAVGSLYMFSVPRGYLDGFYQWCKQVVGLCLTAFLQATILIAGLSLFNEHALLGLGLMLSAGEIPRIAGAFGLDTSTRANLSSAVYTAQTAINITKTVAKAAAA